jgi:hypothetical protein
LVIGGLPESAQYVPIRLQREIIAALRLTFGFWLLAFGFWLLAFGFWLQ